VTQTTVNQAELPLHRDHPLLESIKRIKVIEVGTHLTEPGDLWTSKAPARCRDLVPRVVYQTNSEMQGLVGWRRDAARR
jgi:uncharacterized protein